MHSSSSFAVSELTVRFERLVWKEVDRMSPVARPPFAELEQSVEHLKSQRVLLRIRVLLTAFHFVCWLMSVLLKRLQSSVVEWAGARFASKKRPYCRPSYLILNKEQLPLSQDWTDTAGSIAPIATSRQPAL